MNNLNANNEFGSANREMEMFLSTGSRIIALYNKNTEAMAMERLISFQAHRSGGETEALHMYYLFCIMGFVKQIAGQKDLTLAAPVCDYREEYPAYCAIDTISEVIYNQRKNSLGLIVHNITYEDFSVNAILQICGFNVNQQNLSNGMSKLKNRVIETLDYCNLCTKETILFPWGMASDTFTFHKILATVISCGGEEKYKLKGLGNLGELAAFYEITSSIYYNHYKEKKKN